MFTIYDMHAPLFKGEMPIVAELATVEECVALLGMIHKYERIATLPTFSGGPELYAFVRGKAMYLIQPRP
jgi:hypothetical protein